jgi:hypothetical protein
MMKKPVKEKREHTLQVEFSGIYPLLFNTLGVCPSFTMCRAHGAIEAPRHRRDGARNAAPCNTRTDYPALGETEHRACSGL